MKTKIKTTSLDNSINAPWLQLSLQNIIGVDEVGRGCLAGPVYAAAVILNPQRPIIEYKDSKTIPQSRREELAAHIKENHKWCLGFATVEEISELNILKASLLAMKRAVLGLGLTLEHQVFVDGNQKIFGLPDGVKQWTVIKGDQRLKTIAAASIVAKVARDEWMQEYAKKFPGYSFEKHKGYGTPEHKQAIQNLGPCEIHRPTFAGVKEYFVSYSTRKEL